MKNSFFTIYFKSREFNARVSVNVFHAMMNNAGEIDKLKKYSLNKLC